MWGIISDRSAPSNESLPFPAVFTVCSGRATLRRRHFNHVDRPRTSPSSAFAKKIRSILGPRKQGRDTPNPIQRRCRGPPIKATRRPARPPERPSTSEHKGQRDIGSPPTRKRHIANHTGLLQSVIASHSRRHPRWPQPSTRAHPSDQRLPLPNTIVGFPTPPETPPTPPAASHRGRRRLAQLPTHIPHFHGEVALGRAPQPQAQPPEGKSGKGISGIELGRWTGGERSGA
jgi:hypothetical protein